MRKKRSTPCSLPDEFTVDIGGRTYRIAPVDGAVYFRNADSGLPASERSYIVDHADRRATIPLATKEELDIECVDRFAVSLRQIQLQLLKSAVDLVRTMWEDRIREKFIQVINTADATAEGRQDG